MAARPRLIASPIPCRAIAGLALLLLILTGCAHVDNTDANATIAGEPFTLELALTDAARMQGLSDRHSIPAAGGMLFVFPTVEPGDANHSFVMRRCYVPIDLIYLDPTGVVVGTHQMQVEPYDTPEEDLKRYAAGWPYQLVIELAGGTLSKLHISPGQRVDLRWSTWEDLKKRAQ